MPNQQTTPNPKSAFDWIKEHRTQLLSGAVVLLTLRNRSLRNENLQVLAANLELTAQNESLGRILDVLSTKSIEQSKSVMNEIFGSR